MRDWRDGPRVLLLGVLLSVSVPGFLSCRDNEYSAKDGQCCPMCDPGFVVLRDCTLDTGTRCEPCKPGTYMNKPNGLDSCFPCTNCDPGDGLLVKQNCTNKTNTVCDALNGFFCSLADEIGCSLAEKHSRCKAGQRIKTPGTSRSDTTCEDCQQGSFSSDGINCTAWRVCSNAEIKEEGSLSSDVICSGSTTRSHNALWGPVLLFLILCLTLVTKDLKRKPYSLRQKATWSRSSNIM